MSILDTVSDIADRRTAAATSRRDKGTGASSTGSANDAPVLVRHLRSSNQPAPNGRNQRPRAKTDAAIAGPSDSRLVRTGHVGRLRRILSFIGMNPQQGKNPRRKFDPALTSRASDAAASGMDNFFAGKKDTDPGARKPQIVHPQRDGRSIVTQLRQEREERLDGMFALALFQKLDVNGDGVLSWEELRPLRNTISFDRFDTNGDGTVSWQEFSQNYKQIRTAALEEIKRRKDIVTPTVRDFTRDERRRTAREAELER